MQIPPATSLVVDLDGTLTPADTLAESAIQLIKQSMVNLLRMLCWLVKGRSYFKHAVASHLRFSAEHLPYHEKFLDYLREKKKSGHKIILATASYRSIADSVSTHLQLFDDVIATDKDRNLKGNAKLEAIKRMVGTNFVYCGNSRADIPIWEASQAAVLVGVPSRIAESVRRYIPIEREFPKSGTSFLVWMRAFRIYQWSKNLLLFVPLLTSFSFLNLNKVATLVLAFFAFSLIASATYILNDLWDLQSDRLHPHKRHRPFACAQLSVLQGIIAAGCASIFGFVLALSVSHEFFGLLLLYFFMTLAYSWVLKEYVFMDVVALSLLYTLRILSGSVVIKVTTSSWLLAFSVFLFLSLALIKRCSELVSLGTIATRGRDYRASDLVVLWPLGIGTALSAIVVFGLFINAPETRARYANPDILWLVAIALIYWLARLWIKTSRGEMHDDPIIYAFKDRGSRLIILLMIITMLVAHRIFFDVTSWAT